jgi:repressor LexA
MDAPLTPRQAEILDWIRRRIAESGAPPTRAEIALSFGFSSPNAAETHLRALARKGAIVLSQGTARGIRLAGRMPASAAHLPLVGRVAAGQPVLAEENIEARIEVDPALFRPRADYLLRVHGLSMRDAGILDGDLLAVQKTREAKNGQIVVARLGDDVTVKRFRRTRSTIELIAENPDFKTIVVPFGDVDFELEGVAVGLVRNTMLM